MTDKTRLSRDAALMTVMAFPSECSEIAQMIKDIHKALMDDTIEAAANAKNGKPSAEYTTVLRMNRNQATALITMFTYGADTILSEIESMKGTK